MKTFETKKTENKEAIAARNQFLQRSSLLIGSGLFLGWLSLGLPQATWLVLIRSLQQFKALHSQLGISLMGPLAVLIIQSILLLSAWCLYIWIATGEMRVLMALRVAWRGSTATPQQTNASGWAPFTPQQALPLPPSASQPALPPPPGTYTPSFLTPPQQPATPLVPPSPLANNQFGQPLPAPILYQAPPPPSHHAQQYNISPVSGAPTQYANQGNQPQQKNIAPKQQSNAGYRTPTPQPTIANQQRTGAMSEDQLTKILTHKVAGNNPYEKVPVLRKEIQPPPAKTYPPTQRQSDQRSMQENVRDTRARLASIKKASQPLPANVVKQIDSIEVGNDPFAVQEDLFASLFADSEAEKTPYTANSAQQKGEPGSMPEQSPFLYGNPFEGPLPDIFQQDEELKRTIQAQHPSQPNNPPSVSEKQKQPKEK